MERSRTTRRSIYARIDPDLYRAARVEAAIRDMPFGRLVETALRGELERSETTIRPEAGGQS